MDSSSSNQVQERDTHILDIGQQCSHPSCLLVDFLPFKCQHCKLPFCQEHFRVEHHQCSEYDDSKYIAPSCPLCNQPVFIEQGRDANISMDLHLENNCSVVTGRVKAKTLPTCARVNCQKALISPLQCSSCKKKFCPTHRHPDDHRCQPVPTAAPTTSKPVATSNTPKALANFNAGAKNLNTKATAAGTAAMDAVKKSINTTAIPAARNAINSAKASASASKPKAPLPFSKMDRRARAERESKLRAMQARAKKGLLSEEEKAILAAEEAAAQEKKDCVIM
uniref:AN1-type domain-containing protein n=1 Tax=Psilocybe cubensis TaxID=181762 RepID=A0A8H7Y3Y3_PSICU